MLVVNVKIACYNIKVNTDKTWIRIIILLVIAYLLFVVGKTLYQSYQVRREITGLQNDIINMKAANKDLSEQILYYQSSSYQEKIARERLGLQKPGEQVIVILPEPKPKIVEKDPYDSIPNYQKWWNFFFKA